MSRKLLICFISKLTIAVYQIKGEFVQILRMLGCCRARGRSEERKPKFDNY